MISESPSVRIELWGAGSVLMEESPIAFAILATAQYLGGHSGLASLRAFVLGLGAVILGAIDQFVLPD